jgi:uncharacterized protein (TIGR02594 family)
MCSFSQTVETSAFEVAKRYLGIKEREGNDDHPDIRAWLSRAGLDGFHDETPWCGAFVLNIAFVLGLESPSIPARARSWLTVGEPIELEDLRRGMDIVIFKRGQWAPGPEVLEAPGHVALFSANRQHDVEVVGGNQSDGVTFARYPLHRVIGRRRLRLQREVV